MYVNNNRFESVDILKSIGIISIVIGHACNEYNFQPPLYIHIIKNFVYTYHLMIFAFCSGFLFKYNKELGIKKFIIKRIKSYYLKFLIYAYSLLIFKVIFTLIGAYNYSVIDFIKQSVKIALFINGGGVDGALWFLQMLFIASVFYMLINNVFMKYNISKYPRLAIVLIFGIIGLILNNSGLLVYYRIDAAFIAIPFMEWGYQIRKKMVSLLENRSAMRIFYNIVIFVGLTCVLFSIVFVFDFEIDIAKWKTSPFILFIVASIIGVLWCFSFLHLIMRNAIIKKVFLIIGQNSAIIMAYHFMVFKLCDSIYCWLFEIDSNLAFHPYSYPELRCLYIITGIIFPIAFNLLFVKVRDMFWKREKKVRKYL